MEPGRIDTDRFDEITKIRSVNLIIQQLFLKFRSIEVCRSLRTKGHLISLRLSRAPQVAIKNERSIAKDFLRGNGAN